MKINTSRGYLMRPNMKTFFEERRRVLAALAGVAGSLLLPGVARAEDPVGKVGLISGRATAVRGSLDVALEKGSELEIGDLVKTDVRTIVELLLGRRTTIRLGESAELLIDSFVMNMRGSFDLMQGAMFFDRPEDEPKSDVMIRTVFGQLGVRGTRFFAGPNRGVFAVFVERGAVAVAAGGETVTLGPGEGVNIPEPGAPPEDVVQWGQGRIDEVYASVGL